jgi:hypothetical protein
LTSNGHRLGVTKSEYLDGLREASSRNGMQFALAFMEPCGSYASVEATEYPSDVRTRFASTGSEGYQTIDYPWIWPSTLQAAGLAMLLTAHPAMKTARPEAAIPASAEHSANSRLSIPRAG